MSFFMSTVVHSLHNEMIISSDYYSYKCFCPLKKFEKYSALKKSKHFIMFTSFKPNNMTSKRIRALKIN